MEKITEYLQVERGLDFPGQVTWAQGTNSVAYLESALGNSAVDFIEVDVSLSENGEPIAAHPPIKTSDLTIDALLDKLGQVKIGLKLDFKNEKSVVTILKRLAEHPLEQPVLLNADVLNTADANKAKINPRWFIERCQELYPEGVLSLGWRTSGARGAEYTSGNVAEMIELTKDLDSVTYPVRAKMVPRSWKNLEHLLDQEDKTLTIWNNGFLSNGTKQWLSENTSETRCFYATDLTLMPTTEYIGHIVGKYVLPKLRS